jgi:hypothetical protein
MIEICIVFISSSFDEIKSDLLSYHLRGTCMKRGAYLPLAWKNSGKEPKCNHHPMSRFHDYPFSKER